VTSAVLAGGVSLVVALVMSLVLTGVVRRWAIRSGFLDRPTGDDGHKQHLDATPLGGGIAIAVAILLPLAAGLGIAYVLRGLDPDSLPGLTRLAPNWYHWAGGVIEKTPSALAVIGGAVVMHIMGLIDDRRPLPAMLKLALQFAVALLLTAVFKIRAGELLGPVPAVVLTSLWIVVLTNAFNFMDNMDGLTAGVGTLTALILGIAAFAAGQVFVPCMLMIIAGALLGFLFYNFPPASIFMGDAGSLVVGYMLAISAVLTTYIYPKQQVTPYSITVPLIVFAVPLYDFFGVLVRRYRKGQSIFQADRGHFSHRLVQLGLTPKVAVLTIYLATTATSLSAIILPLLNWAGAVLVFGQCLCVVAIIAILESRNGR
jgi:UDP-GlcNAc:undecaprenyl-phosphate GlcNAc-1-phosphate transferase